ncbi:MAG TPA: hypothetical protein DIC52_19240 [Candidatus Latescibacteria bacterium]|nr:hypothetical protein [Candidatus Latescibacterota bacterium]
MRRELEPAVAALQALATTNPASLPDLERAQQELVRLEAGLQLPRVRLDGLRLTLIVDEEEEL